MTSYRDQFNCPDGHYLLTHSVGCQPVRAAARVGSRFFEPWSGQGADTWPSWLNEIEQFRHHLAKLFGADAAHFCPQTNLSSALTKIIHGVPRRSGRTVIVLAERDFPTIGFVVEQACRAGYEVRYISRDDDVTNPDVWQRSIGNDVHIVCVPHVLSNTGQRLPVEEIASMTRESGAVSVVDIAQSAGIVPIDFAQWRADFVIGSCVKWLCGGPGAGFLWGSPVALSYCEPIDVGWFSHDEPFEMDIKSFRYAPDARRFWGGTPSILPYVVANAALETLFDIGMDVIAQHNAELVDLLIANIPRGYVRSPLDRRARGGTVVVNAVDNAKLAAALTGANVHYDQRPDGLRLSPHIYNTEADVMAAAEHMSRGV